MGATVSCCMSPGGSPKLARRAVELDDYPITTTGDDVSEDTGTYLQHISDREVPDELAQESNPSDNARASTIFLNKSQTDVREKRRSNYLSNHHTSPGLSKKYSSCSTIFLDDSTVSLPNLKSTVKWDSNRSLDIFDEKIHPLTREKVPEDYYSVDPEHKLIYRFVRTLFSSAQLTAECAIVTLVCMPPVSCPMAGCHQSVALWQDATSQLPYGRMPPVSCPMAGCHRSVALWQDATGQLPYGRRPPVSCPMAGGHRSVALWQEATGQLPYGRRPPGSCPMAGGHRAVALWQEATGQLPYGRRPPGSCPMAGGHRAVALWQEATGQLPYGREFHSGHV
uniref:Uncharacterized protein n=1 Tax=Salmo trutta TaxID=8032 RepID=A0A674AST5_SALTR